MTETWNSLEIAKLIVGLLTPVVVVGLTIMLVRFTKKVESTQWAMQRVVEKRLEIYDNLGPHLNDLLCFYCFLGMWKGITPDQVTEYKRMLDKKIHVHAPLFSEEFLTHYHQFMDLCFLTYTGWGEDCKIRALLDKRKAAWGDKWQPEWDARFADQATIEKPETIRRSYLALMSAFSEEIGVNLENSHVPAGQIPKEIR